MHKEILFFLSAAFAAIVSPDCHISISSIILEGFTTRSFTSAGINDCFHQCKSIPWCQSLNYHNHGSLCELNNRTISQKPLNSTKKSGCTYFENPHKAPLGSLESTPAISCQEIKNSFSAASAGYYWILNEKTLQTVKEYCPMENVNSCLALSNGINTLTNNMQVYCHSGWTLIARFSNNDPKNWMRDDGYWWYDAISPQGSTLSTSVNQDMISPTFWLVSGSEIKITRSDDSSHTALLRTTSNCLGSRTFRSMITSFGNFRNGVAWATNNCLGSCDVVYGGQFSSTDGFSQANCSSDIQSSDKIGFWCHWNSGDGSVMMIGGGGSACARADHGIGITEENAAGFSTTTVECDFGDILEKGIGSCPAPMYSLNLWVQ